MSRFIFLALKVFHFLFLLIIFILPLQTLQEGNNVVLLIATTYEEDSGVFTCRATSSAGQVETSARLTVKSKK